MHIRLCVLFDVIFVLLRDASDIRINQTMMCYFQI